MDTSSLVAPAAPVAPPVTPSATPDAAPAAPATPTGLPAALTKVPAIQGLLAGTPVAVSAPIEEFKDTEVGKEIVKNREALMNAGFGFYKSMKGGLAVMFNRFHIHGEDIKAADKAGKLQVIAPPFNQVDHALSKMGGKHMVGKTVPAGFAMPSPQTSPQPGAAMAAGQPTSMDPAAPAGGQASGALQKRLLSARLTNQQPGAPTSGPAPGAGRLLNSILKPVV